MTFTNKTKPFHVFDGDLGMRSTMQHHNWWNKLKSFAIAVSDAEPAPVKRFSGALRMALVLTGIAVPWLVLLWMFGVL